MTKEEWKIGYNLAKSGALTPNQMLALIKDAAELLGVIDYEMPLVKKDVVLDEVARHYSICARRLRMGSERGVDVSLARQMFYYLARELKGDSFPTIGKYMGKDHTTILHGYRKMKELANHSPSTIEDITKITNALRKRVDADKFKAPPKMDFSGDNIRARA